MKFTTEIEGDVLGVGADVTKEFSLSRSPDVNAALIRWMQDVIKLTVEGIERVDAKATLNLRQSVGFAELPVEQKVAQVAMEMASYFQSAASFLTEVTIRLGVSVLPEGNFLGSVCPVASIFTFVPPMSMPMRNIWIARQT